MNALQKASAQNGKGMRAFFQRYPQVAILLAYVVIVIIFSVSSEHFATATNVVNIINQTATICILGFGMTVVLLIGGIDLSVGGIIAFVSCMCAMMLDAGYSPVLTVLAGLGMGLLFGLCSGLAVVGFRIQPFLATLGMMNITRGLSKYITEGKTVVVLDEKFKEVFSQGSIGPMPILIIWIIAVLLVMFFIVGYTPLGRRIQAIGGNQSAAANSGIKVKTIKVVVFMVNGALASLAGFILMSRLGSASGTVGMGAEMDGITAAVLGGTGFNGEGGNMFGTLLGAFVIGTVINGMTILGVDSYLQDVVRGIIIIATVAFTMAINRRAEE